MLTIEKSISSVFVAARPPDVDISSTKGKTFLMIRSVFRKRVKEGGRGGFFLPPCQVTKNG